MMNRVSTLGLAGGLLLVAALQGCGSGAPQPEVIQIKPADPLAAARAVVKRYAEGQPLASEVTSFPKLVEDVRKEDPAHADVLEKGLADIQAASPSTRAARAQALLAKLK